MTDSAACGSPARGQGGSGESSTPCGDAPTLPLPSTDERQTPRWLFEELDDEFRFTLDAAASARNTLCRDYCGLDTPGPQPGCDVICHGDGLAVDWHALAARLHLRPVAWLNPPYSRGSLPAWLRKAEAESRLGCTVVALIPGDTSTEYFHRFVLAGRHETRFLNRRLSFAGAPADKTGRLAPAKFGSVLVVFRPSDRLWTRR